MDAEYLNKSEEERKLLKRACKKALNEPFRKRKRENIKKHQKIIRDMDRILKQAARFYKQDIHVGDKVYKTKPR
jgi:type II secretory ATPase GspE/PulE/Tfp pilus assembly ATPase PilB-like protein